MQDVLVDLQFYSDLDCRANRLIAVEVQSIAPSLFFKENFAVIQDLLGESSCLLP